MKRITTAFLMLFVIILYTNALELKDGLVKIEVNENNGRFALYLLDEESGEYGNLLYTKDNRTSYFTLFLDQKAYKLGQTAGIKFSVKKENESIRLEYSHKTFNAQVVFAIIDSGNGIKDSIKISLTAWNQGNSESEISIRLLLDTWMGEKDKSHFIAEQSGSIEKETLFARGFNDRWIQSGKSPDKSIKLSFDPGSARPDFIIAANWKRINDVLWAFEVKSERNFNYLPYSQNDSALALYWNPVKTDAGAGRSVSVFLGKTGMETLPIVETFVIEEQSQVAIVEDLSVSEEEESDWEYDWVAVWEDDDSDLEDEEEFTDWDYDTDTDWNYDDEESVDDIKLADFEVSQDLLALQILIADIDALIAADQIPDEELMNRYDELLLKIEASMKGND